MSHCCMMIKVVLAQSTLKFRNNIFQIQSSNKDYSIRYLYVLKKKKLQRDNYVTKNKLL